jgi:hypothetical protein
MRGQGRNRRARTGRRKAPTFLGVVTLPGFHDGVGSILIGPITRQDPTAVLLCRGCQPRQRVNAMGVIATGDGLASHDRDAIVADIYRCYGIVRSDPRIEANRQSDTARTRDSTQVRVITRVAAVIPDPASAARSLTVMP